MDSYIIVSLAIVVCLPAWWLFLAISGNRDRYFIPRDRALRWRSLDDGEFSDYDTSFLELG